VVDDVVEVEMICANCGRTSADEVCDACTIEQLCDFVDGVIDLQLELADRWRKLRKQLREIESTDSADGTNADGCKLIKIDRVLAMMVTLENKKGR
jgi:hypothetical protein